MKRTFLMLPLFLFSGSLLAQTLSVEPSAVEGKIEPLIYGSGMEDVNHEIYGGLYDQRIFGEGFEEECEGVNEAFELSNFTVYDNVISLDGDILSLHTDGGNNCKVVKDDAQLRSGSVEVEVRLDVHSAIAGLIIQVDNPTVGIDNFNGYEVGLNFGSQCFVLGKHQYNWQSIASPGFPCSTDTWYKLRVEMNESELVCYVNDEKMAEYTDESGLAGAQVGLRTCNGMASFRNLKINDENVEFMKKPVKTENKSLRQFKSYDVKGELIDGQIVINSPGIVFSKVMYQTSPIEKADIELEMQMEGGSTAGIVFNVSNPEPGNDAFDGYEMSLNTGEQSVVVGKHAHDWQAISSIKADFNPAAWNKLRVSYDGAKMTFYLNDEYVFDYIDMSDRPFTSGLFGVRCGLGLARFRALKINGQEVPLVNAVMGLSAMWDAVGEGFFEQDDKIVYTGNYSQKITGSAGVGIVNNGLNRWGIGIQKDATMHNKLYLRGTCNKAVVSLQNATGTVEYASQTIEGISNSWALFETDLTPNATDPHARYVLELGAEGSLWVDQVLLATDSYPFRQDITQSFLSEGLSMIRYGGCMVNTPEYLCANMIGDNIERQPYKGFWYPCSTNGFAIPEFVQFARLIGAEPVFCVNVDDNPDDVLELLEEIDEYQPRMIEIGNEELINTSSKDAYLEYTQKFLNFYDAIHPVYPDMKFVIAAWWRSDCEDLMHEVFTLLDGKADYWDFHPVTNTPLQALNAEKEIRTMESYFGKWNSNTTMRCAILEENGQTHNMERALAHAVMLNVIRRSGGFVPLDSPANALQPYGQNDNGWDQGQIFFNTSETWMQPPYYAQQMAAAYHQPLFIYSNHSSADLDVSATRNEAGDTIVLHIVNWSKGARSIPVELVDFAGVKSAKTISLSGPADGENKPSEPITYVPLEEEIEWDGNLIVKPFSYTILVLSNKDPDAVKSIQTSNQSDKNLTWDLGGRVVPANSPGFVVRQNRVIYNR